MKVLQCIPFGNAAADAFSLLDDESVGRIVRAVVFALRGELPAVPKPLRPVYFAVFAEVCRIRGVKIPKPQDIYFAETPEEAQDANRDNSDISENPDNSENGDISVEEKRREESRTGGSPPLPPARAPVGNELQGNESTFIRFWNAYPKKSNRKEARKAWLHEFDGDEPPPGVMDSIIAAIERGKKSDQWRRDAGRFIPLPATWIEGRRWEDSMDQLGPLSSGFGITSLKDPEGAARAAAAVGLS